MKKRKERPKSPALSTTTTIDAYYSKKARRTALPATQAPVMVVGGLPASVWRHALRFVDNKSLAQNVCRVNRIFQRLAMRVLRERERHGRAERQKQKKAAAVAKNTTDPGLFSSGHFVDGDDEEEEEGKNEDDITNRGDPGVANKKGKKSPTTLRKKDGPRPSEVIVVHASPTPSLAGVGSTTTTAATKAATSPRSPTTTTSRKSEETVSTSPRRKKNEAEGHPRQQSRAVSPGLRFKAPLALKKLSTSSSPATSSFFNPAPLTGNITLAPSSSTTSSSSSSSPSSSSTPSTTTTSTSTSTTPSPSPSPSPSVLQVGPPACRQHALLCVRQYSKTKSRHFWSCNHPLPHLRCGFHSWVSPSTTTTAAATVAEEDQMSPAKSRPTAQPTPTEPPPAEQAAAETEAEAKVAPPSPTILERMRRLEQMRSDSTLIINILGKRRNSRDAPTMSATTTGGSSNTLAYESDPPQPQSRPPAEPISDGGACDPANAKPRKKVRVDKKSQQQTTVATTTSKPRASNSVFEVLVGCSEDQTAATLNYSQLFISPHTVKETQEEATAYDLETLPYTFAPAFNPDSCPPLSFNLNLALEEPLAATHDDGEHDHDHDRQQQRDPAAPYVAEADADDDDDKEVDDPLLMITTPSSSVSATALRTAAIGEAEKPEPRPRPQPAGGIHEWSTELDETEPYSLSASLSPSTPVSTKTTAAATSSSGSSTAEPPTSRESNEAETADASKHRLDEAEANETSTPKSTSGALLPPREDEPSEDLLHSNFECVDQAASCGGDELEALRAELRALRAQLTQLGVCGVKLVTCQSRNAALERENEQLRRGRDRDRDLLTSFHHQLALTLAHHEPQPQPPPL